MNRFILLTVSFIILLSTATAVQIGTGVTFNTTDTGAYYYISTPFNATSITVYPIELNINGGNITTYSDVNMSMESLTNGTYLAFTNDVPITNLTITNNFANFTIVPDSIYQICYQSNDSVFQQNISTTGIYYTSIPAGSWYITFDTILTSLLSPSNSSTIYTTYPPLSESVTFTWSSTDAPQYRLIIAEDENFNIISTDQHVGANYSVQSLLVNKEYWWKVIPYDGTTYSNQSDVFSFNLTGNSTLTGVAIEGVVYASVGGENTPLSGAEVLIWNSTWSDSAITGSNGYYLFTALTSGQVYNVQAKKDLYLDSSVALVNTTSDPVTQDFFMLPDRATEEWRHYVKFTVWGISGYYEGVTVTVYENDDVTALYTGTTGSDGSIAFIMDRNQEYRVTFIDAVQGINKEMTLYPKDDSYIIFIAWENPWSEYELSINEAIDINITTQIINATSASINVSYSDALAQTTDATIYLNQSNQSDPYNETVVSSQTGLSGNWSHSFIVSDYHGESYYVHVVATHTTYGTVDKTYAVGFDDNIIFDGIPSKFFLYLAIFVMLFTSGMFGVSSAPQGALIVLIEGWAFLAFGWFVSVNETVIGTGLAFATVFAIANIINHKNKKEGIE